MARNRRRASAPTPPLPTVPETPAPPSPRPPPSVLGGGPFSAPEPDKLPIGGPMTGPLASQYNGLFDAHFADDITMGLTHEQVEAHSPVMRLQAYDPAQRRPLTAADQARRRPGMALPTMYANPMQSVDYIVYEQLMKSTFVGPLHHAFMRYVYGKGFKPVLRLINPDADPAANAATLEQYQPIIDTLLQIDRNIDRRMKGSAKTFRDLMLSAITSMLSYNRSCLMFGWDEGDAPTPGPDSMAALAPGMADSPPRGRMGQEINGVRYPEIPNYLVFAHPRDIGLIEVDPYDRQITKVQWRNAMMEMTPANEVIYLWNKPMSQDSYNSEYYSTSMLTPLVPLAKIIRKGVQETIPSQQDLSWMGRFLVIAKNEGQTFEQKHAEWQQLARNCPPGRPNIIIKNPDDVAVHPLPADAQVLPLAEIIQMCIKIAISCLGLPQVAFYDESAANRATMVGKIQLTHRTTIEPMREWIGQMICDQWYGRWFNLIFPELADTFEIALEWTNLQMAEWYDNIQAALELDGRRQLKDHDFGELAGIENYETMVEPDALATPGGDPGRITLADSRTGQEFELRQRRQAINQMKDQAMFAPPPEEGGGGGDDKGGGAKGGKKKGGGKKE